MAAPRINSSLVDVSQDAALSGVPASQTVVVNENSDSQFVSVGGPSLAEIINQGNVACVYQTANNTYINAYRITPTQQFITNEVNQPAGPNLSLQYNSNGVLEGSSTLTFNPTSGVLTVPGINVVDQTTISNVANFKLGGGSPGYVLQTQDGNGNLSWVAQSGSGNGNPGGVNTQVQFNDAGMFAGTNALTINKTTNVVAFGNTIGSDLIPNANVTYTLGNATNRWKDLYLSNNSLYLGNTKLSTDGSNLVNTADLYINDVRVVQLAITNTSNSTIIVGGNAPAGNTQPIVQLGGNTTTIVQVGSNANSNITASGGNLVLPNISLVSGGTANFTGANVTGGNFSNVTLTNVTIANSNVTSINNGNSNVVVTPNSNVVFGVAGTANVLTVTSTTSLANSFTSNNFILGNATVTVSTQRWVGASTTVADNQIIYSIPAANVSSVDYHITATDGTSSRQVSKLLAVNLGTTTNYTEYGGMWVGPQIVDFTVAQANSNINLQVNTLTSNTIQYNIVLTIYN